MLDSLVRVSRRVGWGADHSPLTHRCKTNIPNPRPSQCGQQALQAVLASRTPSRRSSSRNARPEFLAHHSRPAYPRPIRSPTKQPVKAAPQEIPCPGASRCQISGRGALRQESAAAVSVIRRAPEAPAAKRESATTNRAKLSKPESPPSTLRSHPFTCKRFHVLSNSLFKVLFNFPSPYLFAIGLVQVFSLRWSLPPTLGCILKQPDSGERQRDRGRHRRGLTPALGQAPIRRTRTT